MSRRSKVVPICYTLGNTGVVIRCSVSLLEGASIPRSIVALLVSLLGINLLLWFLLRSRNKSRLSVRR